MVRFLVTIGLFIGGLGGPLGLTLPAAATPCPDRIQYKNGGYLKNGDTYYYANGTLLIRNNAIHYPTGQYLKRDNSVYYANGTYLQRDTTLYYPNGSTLKRDDRYHYANGAYLKNGDTFYYGNGALARRNGKLYRPDGTETAFPVTLREEIAGHGYVAAEVSAATEYVEVEFNDLKLNTAEVRGSAVWSGNAFTHFYFDINTGVPGEDLFVTVGPAGTACSLGTGGSAPSTFTVNGRAGSARVRVNPGFNANAVRRAVQQALDYP